MLPEKPWRAEAVLRLGAGLCMCLLLGMLTVAGLGRFLPRLGQAEQNLVTLVVGALSFQGAALVWILFFLREHQVGWAEAFGFSWDAAQVKRALGLGALGIVVAMPVVTLLGQAVEVVLVRAGVTPQVQLVVKMLQQKPPPLHLVVFGFQALLLAPVAEEMLFRGILYPTLKQSGHPQLALWVSSVLFASTHMNLMALVPLTFLAVILTWLYEKTANLLAPILTHILFNAISFTLLVLQPPWMKLHS